MAKIELTVSAGYVKSWGLYEAVREFLQNLRDARVMHGAEVRVRHDSRTNKLTMVSVGKTMDARALLLGYTTKEGVAGAAGKYGEGMKLGLLALARLKHDVWIHTGDETWAPGLERSTAFGGEEILVVWTRKCAPKNEVRVEVGGIDAVAWAEIKKNFLFLEETGEIIETSRGRLLLHPSYQGKMFIKGIFVQRLDDLSYGYDFDNDDRVGVDRDRKMIDAFSAKWESTAILAEAARDSEQLKDGLYRNMRRGRVDGSGGAYTNLAVQVAMAERFRTEFGAEAIPVETEEQAKDLRYLGGVAVVVPRPLFEVLTPTIGTPAAARARLFDQSMEIVQTTDLTPAEKANYDRACATVFAFITREITLPLVALFPQEELFGKVSIDADGEQIYVARKCLARYSEVLRVLIHEVAHIESGAGDNDARHTTVIESLWQRVYESAVTS